MMDNVKDDISIDRELLRANTNMKKVMCNVKMLLPHPLFDALVTIEEKSADNEDGDGVKTSDISKALTISKPATTQVIDDLVKKNYVKRVSEKSDRRIVMVVLTDEGKQILATSRKKFSEILATIVEKVGEDDIREYIRLLNKIALAFEDVAN